ncbi:MAG TPA: PLP-dependent aminotransferase family protein [Usitatibacter sp.]|nr:PLP-dependent aminotransferase family protein [Usitatibacter sp.]
MKAYQRLVDEFSRRIEEGVLLPGDRLPSVRSVSASRRVSPDTVLRAYRALEGSGMIRTRPRSGHYVDAHWRHSLREPPATRPAGASSHVNVRDLIFDLLASARSGSYTSFGSAYPGAELFPREKLAKAMHASARCLDPNSIYDCLPLGNQDLRHIISRRYLEAGCDVAPEEIIITSGALEALNLCLQALTRPGDVVAIECPAFYLALEAIERLGLKVVELPTHPRDGVSVPALAAALDRHPIKACWLMTNFQNPLGSLMPTDAKKDLVRLLARHDVALIEDDAYAELYFGKTRPAPAKAFDRGGRVLHCGSFSKCLAPGYRVGWAAPGRHVAEVERAKLTTTVATSIPAQAAVAEFVKHGGYNHHLRKLRGTLEANQLRMSAAIEAHFPAGTRVTTPTGGYFLWVVLPESVDALEVHRRALEEKISVAPGPLFSPRGKFENCLRLNYGLSWSPRLDDAMTTLGKIVSSLARSQLRAAA